MLKNYIAPMLVAAAALAPVSYAYAHGEGISVGPARVAAIHECSVISQRYPETTFSSLEFELYRACMARHGQVE
jgi:hypothetical protein